MFLVALILAGVRTPLVAGQGATLVSMQVAGPLPLDPTNDVWRDATALTLPLTAQKIWIPHGGGSIGELTIRAATNGTWLAFLVEWRDETKDVDAYRTEDFPDAVAIQIATTGRGIPPYACMGQADSQVQIWHWRANRDVPAGADASQAAAYPYALANLYPFADDPTFYPGWAVGNFLASYNTTPVQTLVSGGPGTLTSTETHTVYGLGVHADGRWRVVFARPLTALAADELLFQTGDRLSVAVAAWDGSRGDRDGQKSVSSWVTFALEPLPFDWLPYGLATVAVLVVVASVYALRRRWLRERASAEEQFRKTLTGRKPGAGERPPEGGDG